MIYPHSLSVICPEPLFDAANTIAACIGEGGIHDLRSFTMATLEDAEGNRYGLVNTRCKEGLYGALVAGQLQLPDVFPIEGEERDMPAAKQALAECAILIELDPEAPLDYIPGTMVVGAGLDGWALVSAMGLTSIVEDVA